MVEGLTAPLEPRQRLLRTVRKTIVTLAAVVAALYVTILVLLVVFQRDLIFVGGRHAVPVAAYPSYRARTVHEVDGAGVVLWQSAPPAAGKPTIVFFYGNAGTISDFAALGEELQREGYGVVLASYRGYSGNSGHPSEDGLMADARAILAAIPKSYGPIVLWGQSLGSGVAARMAAEKRAAALILQSPYTSIADVAAMRFPIFPIHLLIKDRFDTASLTAKIKVPVLIMHGTADAIVPFDMGAALSRRFGNRVRFVPIPGRGHNDLSAQILLPIAEAWLRANAAAIGAHAAP